MVLVDLQVPWKKQLVFNHVQWKEKVFLSSKLF